MHLPSVYTISWSRNVATCLEAPSQSPLSLCSRVFTDSFPTLPCKKYSSWFFFPNTAIFFFKTSDFRTFTRDHRSHSEDTSGFIMPEKRHYLSNSKLSNFCYCTSKVIWINIWIEKLRFFWNWNFVFVVKYSCIRKMAWDWRNHSHDTLRDYKSCGRQKWSHRGRHPSENWRNTKTFRGKHHQVARALEAVTISNMTTTEEPQVEEKQPVEKKVVG